VHETALDAVSGGGVVDHRVDAFERELFVRELLRRAQEPQVGRGAIPEM
jgi:hypothetical protein